MIGSQSADCMGEVEDAQVTANRRKKAFGDCLTVEVSIAGVKTKCLLDTGSEVTTITDSYFRKHFKDGQPSLSGATWVRLTAANGLEIPVVGCLQADIVCMRKTLPGKCIFVLKDTTPTTEEVTGVPGILGMNVIAELRELLFLGEDLKKMDN